MNTFRPKCSMAADDVSYVGDNARLEDEGNADEVNSDKSLDQLLFFLEQSSKRHLREVAAQHILGLSSSNNGQTLIRRRDDCIARLVQLTGDSNLAISKLILQSFVNLSANEELNSELLSYVEHVGTLVSNLLLFAVNEGSNASADVQEAASMVLSNLSRVPSCCRTVWQQMPFSRSCSTLEKIVTSVCSDVDSVNHLAMFLCNLSQLEEFRKQLMDQESTFIARLLPLLNYMKSDIRRKGIAGVIRNCCFDTDQHGWLLGNKINILTALVYPLAGPEEFDEEDMSELPLELQYLGDDKKHEPNPEIRKMLLESINQLCATKDGRKFIRDQRIYLIMRELHKWEPVDEVVTACENLVDILIGDEPEPGMDNLKEIVIPNDLQVKFQTMDNDLLKK